SMYIPVVGWIILGAILLIEVSKRLPAPERIALPGFALFFVAYLAGESKSTSRDAIYNGQQKTWNYIQETKRLELHVPSDGSILFLDDPFDGWDMEFITRLVTGNRTMRIDFLRRMDKKPTTDEYARYTVVLRIQDEKLVRVERN